MNAKFFSKVRLRYRISADDPRPSDGMPAGSAPLVFLPLQIPFAAKRANLTVSQNWGSV
jgi:hypothetical protein